MAKDWMDEFRERFRGGHFKDRTALLFMMLALQQQQQQQVAGGPTGTTTTPTNPLLAMLPLFIGDRNPMDLLLFSMMANPGMDLSQMMPFLALAMDWDRPRGWEGERGPSPFHVDKVKVEEEDEEEDRAN